MYKVAVIGAGPAGIAMGAELVNAGISADDILICEKTDKDNSSIRQFYPAGKEIHSIYKNIVVEQKGVVGFSDHISLEEYHTMINSILAKNNLKLTTNTEVQKIIKQEKGFKIETSNGEFESEFVVLASGVFAKPRKPNYPISGGLFSKISYDILNIQKQSIEGLDILVVGGGDSASEYVQILSEMNNHVSLSYRQETIFRMNSINLQKLNILADNKKIDLLLGTNITSIEADNEKIRVHFQEREDLIVDRIVYSLGGASPTEFMAKCGLTYDDTNVVLREHCQTDIDGLYMIGDLASGRKGGSLMLAFNGASDVMKSLKAYI